MGVKELMTALAGGSHPRAYHRDGLTLGYSVVGDVPPILFVHGATATGEFEWGRLAARLASDYQCVLPDLRGHGRSEFRESGNLRGSATPHRAPGPRPPPHRGVLLRCRDLAHA